MPLDVSLDSTAICIVDDAGAVVCRGKCPSEPKAIAETLARRAPGLVRAGLETGQHSNWLTLALRRLRVPVTCLDARHAEAALALQVPSSRSAPVKVVVFQCPCGIGERQRCPRFARPRRRAILVEAPFKAVP